MAKSLIALLSLLVLGPVPSAHAAEQDGTILRWKLKKGDRLMLKTESRTRTVTVASGDAGEPQTEKETDREVRRYAVNVLEVRKDGSYVLEMIIDSMDKRSRSPKRRRSGSTTTTSAPSTCCSASSASATACPPRCSPTSALS